MGVVDDILTAPTKRDRSDRPPPLELLAMAARLLNQPSSVLPNYPVPAVLMHHVGTVLYDADHPDARHARIPRWRNSIGVTYAGRFSYSVCVDPQAGRSLSLNPWLGESICLSHGNFNLEVCKDRIERIQMLPSCDPDEVDDGFYHADRGTRQLVRTYLDNRPSWQG